MNTSHVCVTLSLAMALNIYSHTYSQQNDLKAPRIRALKAITEFIPSASVEFEVSIVERDLELEASISCSYDQSRLRLKRTYRSKQGEDESFSNWFGPELVVLPGDDTVLSRVKEYKNSTVRQSRDRAGVDSDLRLFWPQFIGTSIGGVWDMPENSPRGILEQSSFQEIRTERVLFGNQPAIKVEYKSASLPNMQVWYLEKCGGLIGRMAISGKATRTSFSYQSEIKLKEWEPGVWYPEDILTERHIDGERVFLEKVHVVKFKRSAPDEEIFGLAGVELEQGGILCDETRGDGNYFRLTKAGLELMSPTEVSTAFIPEVAQTNLPENTQGIWLYVVLFIVANVVALGILFGYSKKWR